MAQGRMFQSAIVFGKNENLKMSLFAFFAISEIARETQIDGFPSCFSRSVELMIFSYLFVSSVITRQCDHATVADPDFELRRGPVLFYFSIFYFISWRGAAPWTPPLDPLLRKNCENVAISVCTSLENLSSTNP